MARCAPRVLAACATAVGHVLDALAADGAAIAPVLRDALALATRVAHGDTISKATLTRTHKAADASSEQFRRWQTPLEKRTFWTAGQVANVLSMTITGNDASDDTLRQAAYGLPGDDGDANDAQVRAWFHAALTASPLAASARPTKRSPAERAGLARIAKALGKHGALLASRGARFRPRTTADAATTRLLLTRHDYPAHACVLAFEKTFGGLLIPDEPDGPDDMATLVGPYACLRSDAHVHPTGGRSGLVPVAYTANDGIVFLDRAGAAYYQDTIEDPAAKRFAPSGAAALTRLLRSP